MNSIELSRTSDKVIEMYGFKDVHYSRIGLGKLAVKGRAKRLIIVRKI